MMDADNPGAAEAVKRMKRYIDENIHKPITAKNLADAAGYSQYHAARVFRKYTGNNPFTYLRQQRLIQSALRLRSGEGYADRKGSDGGNHGGSSSNGSSSNGNGGNSGGGGSGSSSRTKIIDVAFDFVFDSHEGFTRAFTSAFGITPKKFASLPKPSDWVIPYSIIDRRNKTRKEEGIGTSMHEQTAIIFTQIVERPLRKLLLRRSKAADDYFSYCEEFGCVDDGTGNSIPWDTVSKIKEALYEPVGLWLPENMRPEGTGVYAHGVELPDDFSGDIPDGFELIELQPCKMLVFQGEPYDDEHFEEAITGLWERIETFNPVVYGYEYADELAPRMQLAPMGWRGYIEMRPIREILP